MNNDSAGEPAIFAAEQTVIAELGFVIRKRYAVVVVEDNGFKADFFIRVDVEEGALFTGMCVVPALF